MKAIRPLSAFAGWGRAAQDVSDVISRDRIGHAPFADHRRPTVEPLDERRRLAASREAGIEPREVGQRNAEPAKADGKADRRILRQRNFSPGAVQTREESCRADIGKELDRRQVERHLQRLARCHRALVAEIEILRRVSAIAHGTVEQPRLGMRETLFERQRIDEGFQRRARRARRARHVDRAVARRIVVVGGADAGANFAGRIVDDDDRPRQFRASRATLSFANISSFACKRASIESLMTLGSSVSGDRFLGRMRGERRKGEARLRHRLALGRCGVGIADHAPRGDTVEHAVASRARNLGRAIRPRASGDCGSATRSAASAMVSRSGSLPK